MSKFFNILNRKLTVGTVFSIIATFIFAIIVRYSYQYLFDYLPVRGELGALDISYFGIVVFFRFIFSAFLEYLLEDKFSIPLFGAIGEGVGQKGVTTFSMVNSDPQGSSVENSFKGKNTVTKQDDEVEKERKLMLERNVVFDKMRSVLNEQSDKIFKLRDIKARNVKFYDEDGTLEISPSPNMTDSEIKKLSKEVGALDRSLQNKFSEYRNLSRKDVRLYESYSTSLFKELRDHNQKLYEELFEEKK